MVSKPEFRPVPSNDPFRPANSLAPGHLVEFGCPFGFSESLLSDRRKNATRRAAARRLRAQAGHTRSNTNGDVGTKNTRQAWRFRLS